MPSEDDSRRALTPLRDTSPLPGVTVTAHAADVDLSAAVLLKGLLLPEERAVLVTTPHPFVVVRPLVTLAVTALVIAAILAAQHRVLLHGHHVTAPLVTGPWRLAALAFAVLVTLRLLLSFANALRSYFGFRVAATNRRVFVVEGIARRRTIPYAFADLAAATLQQGPLGRIMGYGTILLPRAVNGPPALRDVREPLRLYRQCQAVGYGVDGATWTPPIRQTIVP